MILRNILQQSSSSWRTLSCGKQQSCSAMHLYGRRCYGSSSHTAQIPNIFHRAQNNLHSTAIVDKSGSYSFQRLLNDCSSLSETMKTTRKESTEYKIAYLCPRDYSYVLTKFAVWHSGSVAVPLATSHAKSELEYLIQDSAASLVVYHPMYEDKIKDLAQKLKVPALSLSDCSINWTSASSYSKVAEFDIKTVTPSRDALIIYTSGTTGKPKGVLSSHFGLEAQITGLVKAWQWSSEDKIINILPLHHVHGIVNVLLCSLWSGATCEMHTEFNPERVWSSLTCTNSEEWPKFEPNEKDFENSPTVFMAVPTIYSRMIAFLDSKGKDEVFKTKLRKVLSENIRLFVSGSAALPVPVMNRFFDISGHYLLERYGMTEIGMALSNPYEGPRLAGTVGVPLPGVKAILVDIDKVEEVGLEHYQSYVVEGNGSGELWISGPTVFEKYLNRPEATAEVFVNGWFRTGDSAGRQDGVYSILGRLSADILKCGGYKIGALEIESKLLEHEDIAECTVFGVADEEWGQKIATLIVKKNPNCNMDTKSFRDWAKGKMSGYKVPTLVKFVDSIPRNAMGKVNKKELAKTIKFL